MAEYEIWLTDDHGRRLELITELAFITYTRTVRGLGSINVGIPFDIFSKRLNPFFIPDWRIDVWRSPAHGYPMRREDTFLLRKPSLYMRDDGMKMLQFYGRNGVDLLHRRSVIQRAGTSQTAKTDQADDMMKAIVREQMLYGSALDEDGVVDNARAWAQNEFLVQGDVSLGPSVTMNFADKKVVDVLKDIQNATFQKNALSASDLKIYFDVIPVDVSSLTTSGNAPLGWEFRTFANRYGLDRTQGIEFSVENENLDKPTYSLNHLEEVTSVWVKGNGQASSQIISNVQDAARMNVSRWNNVEKIVTASQETSSTGLQNVGQAELYNNIPKEELNAILLNTPGSPTTPRSLYGLDWDLGDIVRVNYGGKQFDVEISTVYVSVNDSGAEEITGRNIIQ